MGYWRDPDFQQKLVMFLCRDRNFLKDIAPILTSEDFTPRRGESRELSWIADLALEFWRSYNEPIGGMLRTEVLELAKKRNVEGTAKEKLLAAADAIKKADNLVAVEALKSKVIEYKARRARQAAVAEIIQLEADGELSNQKLADICNSVLKNFGSNYTITDYFEGLEGRLIRRRMEKLKKWPSIFIDPIDERIRVLARGNVGLLLAQYKVGKSVFFVWLAYAYAMQGYKVLYFTLEDPLEEVEDRLDALFTRIAMRSLINKPNTTKKRFSSTKEIIKAKIKIVDATDGGLSVGMIESIWDQERNKGYNADVVLVDYDDEIEPPRRYGNDKSARRFEFADIYRELRKFASRRRVFLWTAAQAKRGQEDQKIIKGEDVAEDISKIRKVAFCMGIGRNSDFGENGRYLYVAAHKYDLSRIGFDVVGDFAKGVFYDKEATDVMVEKMKALKAKSKIA